MNIYKENIETCILCRTGAGKGDRYYVRTDVKSIAGDLLSKIPRYLANLFDFLPSNSSTSFASNALFCCRTCKKLLEKRQKQADNLASVENDIRNRRKLGSSVRSLSFAEDISGVGPLPEPLASTPSARAPVEKPNLTCDLSPIRARPTTCTSSDNNPLASETGKLCQWINKHKHELQIGRRAR